MLVGRFGALEQSLGVENGTFYTSKREFERYWFGSMLDSSPNAIGTLGGGSLVPVLSANVLPAEKLERATEKREESVARSRWQQDWLFQRGKGKKVWVGHYREDVIAEDGTRRRRARSVLLGPIREVSKRQAQRKLFEFLAPSTRAYTNQR